MLGSRFDYNGTTSAHACIPFKCFTEISVHFLCFGEGVDVHIQFTIDLKIGCLSAEKEQEVNGLHVQKHTACNDQTQNTQVLGLIGG